MYWWQNPIKLWKIIGKPILKVTGEGCQARNEFQWLGVVEKIQVTNRENRNKLELEAVIRIVIHNHSYGDSRDSENKERITYPLVNSDIQFVDGVWILYK